MNFYRVFKKDDEDNFNVVMAIFITKISAVEYCELIKKLHPDAECGIDEIDGNIGLSKAFIS